MITLIMKLFFAFVRKEFFHIFRDKRTIMILLIMPVIQIILFGFAITTEVKNVRVAVLDPSGDVATRHLTDRLEASEYFTIARVIHTPAEIEPLLLQGECDLVVVFESSFYTHLMHTGRAQVQLIADATDPNMATLMTSYASAVIEGYRQELAATLPVPLQLSSEVKLLYNPEMRAAYNFVPGVMGLILMLICAMMTSISIVREKETGTMELLLVSPIRPMMIIAAKVVPYFALSCINLITILLLSVFVLHVPVAGSLWGLLLLSLLFILVSLSLGIFISTLVRSQVAAMLISGMALMMPVMLLSGLIFPVENMPRILQWISHVIPAKWYILSVKKLMIEGVPVSYVTKELMLLSGMAVVLWGASLKKFSARTLEN